MALINYINTGSGANTGDGDSLRTAFTKINLNFDTLVSNFVAAGVTSWNGRVGIVNFTNTDLLTILGFEPYPASNPEGYVTSSTISLSNYAPLSYVNTSFVFVSDLAGYNFASTNYVDLKLTEYPTLNYLDTQQYLTSINLPSFLTSYVTDAELGIFGNTLRSFTTSTVFEAVNNSNLIPSVADLYNLGDEAYRWSTLYLANAIYLQGIGISVDPTTGRLLVDGNDITAGFKFTEFAISKTNEAGFYISNTDSPGLAGSANTWISIPGQFSAINDPLILSNTGTSGILLAAGQRSITLNNNGVTIQGNVTLPLRLKGTQFTAGGFTFGDHYLDIKPNTWLRTFYDEDLVVPQAIVSHINTNTFAPLNLKGNIVTLISNTATDDTRELDIEFSGLLAVSQDGIFIGVSDTEGSGNPANADSSFEGYRLPLTRGSIGQVLSVVSTGTYTDILNWSTSVSLTQLKTIVAASTDFADFKSRIAAL